MPFNDYELSAQDSRPDELYDFIYAGDDSHQRFTSSAFQIDFDGETYYPLAISRTEIKNTGEPAKNGITVTVNNLNNPYFMRFVLGTLTHETTLSVYVLQPEDTFALAWTGYIKAVDRNSTNIQVECGTVSNDINKPIMHRKYQRVCPHSLYGHYCGVNQATYTHSGVIDLVSGSVLTSTTFGAQVDGYFTGGNMIIGVEGKTIIKHVGDEVTLLDPFYNAAALDTFTAYAGCDHTMTTCETKFSNNDNFGGFQWIPSDDNITTGKPFIF